MHTKLATKIHLQTHICNSSKLFLTIHIWALRVGSSITPKGLETDTCLALTRWSCDRLKSHWLFLTWPQRQLISFHVNKKRGTAVLPGRLRRTLSRWLWLGVGSWTRWVQTTWAARSTTRSQRENARIRGICDTSEKKWRTKSPLGINYGICRRRTDQLLDQGKPVFC